MSSSYASILLSKPAQPTVPIQVAQQTRLPSGILKDDIAALLQQMASVPPTDALRSLITSLRNDMESSQPSQQSRFQTRPQSQHGGGGGGGGGGGFSLGGNRDRGDRGDRGDRDRDRGSFQPLSNNWRNGNRFSSVPQSSSSHSLTSMGSSSPRTPLTPSPAVGRYQSKFTSGSKDMDEKILNTVIGNKLNSFTSATYDDTRDFIYQIMDSGETEFIRDFVEKVFSKATSEDLYCALFAKLLAEIANRYPVMYEEMNRYHHEFVKIFETVQEDKETEYVTLVKQKQYRMGYGLFLSELASSNALEKEQLFATVSIVVGKLETLVKEEQKTKTVEEFIDCLSRLLKSLKDRSPKYFADVKEELRTRILLKVDPILQKTVGPCPSLTTKSRFGLMDLKDILAA